MMDQQTIQLFVATRDSLKGRDATLFALMDFADNGSLLSLFEYPWIMEALERRGLVESHHDEWHYMNDVGMKYQGAMITLTDYGRAFVAWYRQPRDLPTQMSMFDDTD